MLCRTSERPLEHDSSLSKTTRDSTNLKPLINVFGAGYIYPYDVCSLGRLTGMSQRCRLRHDPFRKPSLFLCHSSSESVRVLRFSYILNTIDQCINTEAHIHLTSSDWQQKSPCLHGLCSIIVIFSFFKDCLNCIKICAAYCMNCTLAPCPPGCCSWYTCLSRQYPFCMFRNTECDLGVEMKVQVQKTPTPQTLIWHSQLMPN